jgi:conjugative transfer signal peptidase TraF
MAEPGELPLFVWSDTRLAAPVRRRRMRLAGLCVVLGAGALGLTIAAPPAPRLLWNASASAPIGLYRVHPGARVARGDTVVVRLPAAARALAAARRYLPAKVPAVKRLAATAGDRVCACGAALLIDGRVAAGRLAADARGRALPRWNGCRTLRPGEIFLLMPDSPTSFDGRYFGVSHRADVVGKAVLLWSPASAGTADD